jgi:hypothetical protein
LAADFVVEAHPASFFAQTLADVCTMRQLLPRQFEAAEHVCSFDVFWASGPQAGPAKRVRHMATFVGMREFALCVVSVPVAPEAEGTADQFLVHDARVQMRIALPIIQQGLHRPSQHEKHTLSAILPANEWQRDSGACVAVTLAPVNFVAANRSASIAASWIKAQLQAASIPEQSEYATAAAAAAAAAATAATTATTASEPRAGAFVASAGDFDARPIPFLPGLSSLRVKLASGQWVVGSLSTTQGTIEVLAPSRPRQQP